MIDKATITEWRSEQGSGYQSALGEYTPIEFWELLDAYELQLKRILALEKALARSVENEKKAQLEIDEVYAMYS